MQKFILITIVTCLLYSYNVNCERRIILSPGDLPITLVMTKPAQVTTDNSTLAISYFGAGAIAALLVEHFSTIKKWFKGTENNDNLNPTLNNQNLYKE